MSTPKLVRKRRKNKIFMGKTTKQPENVKCKSEKEREKCWKLFFF